ncbi:hypothetical protein SEUCBS139899_007940 [Sporothrix eucalyptigena]|uniref:Pentatricopeptide repeat protein n=1 Tax=Sporothrix eucalyptigena TaxID=1812306 RepID=A0ABP0CFB4_9PEZI
MAPPSPPVPVPSKAAIRALRGLVLGTTCTLALVTEDRRRRINAARSAIRNGDRIRSARQYHPGGSAFAIALEEDSLSVEPAEIHWNTPSQQGRRNEFQQPASRPSRTANSMANWPDAMLVPAPLKRPSSPTRKLNGHPRKEATSISSTSPTNTDASTKSAASPELQAQSSTTAAAAPPLPRMFAYPAMANQLQKPTISLDQQSQEYTARAQLGRLSKQNVIPVTRTEPVPMVNFQATNTQIKELFESKRTEDLQAVVKALASTWLTIDASSDQQSALGEASAKLCRRFQKSNRMDLAQEVLQLAVKFGRLDEATYFAHNPLRVVLSLAPLDALQAEKTDAAMAKHDAVARRDTFVKRLEDAANLFLPASSSLSFKGMEASDSLVNTAKQLINCAFAASHHDLINSIYASTSRLSGDNISKLSQWFHSKLRKAGNPALSVSHFVAHPPLADSLSKAKFYETGDRIVEATRLSHYTQAGAVFEVLIALGTSTSNQLSIPWVTDLLYGQWHRSKDFSEIKSLFSKLKSGRKSQEGVSAAIYHIRSTYRVMVQIALEAGLPAEAKALFSEVTVLEPPAADDVRILGLFALEKAKAGDWQGVQGDFQQAATAAGDKGLDPRDTERVFMPIAKEYVRTHTISEAENFLKMCVNEIGVPCGKYMFTLLANEYSALREPHSFIAWLEYCTKSGLAVDAAFTNSILRSLEKHWKLGFQQLQEVYLQLSALGPSLGDRVTQTIMTHAAISRTKRNAQPDLAEGRIESVNVDKLPAPAATSQNKKTVASTVSTDRHFVDVDDLYLSMRQAFALDAPAKVVEMFKHAMRNGMPSSTKCLKLAVAAAVKSGLPAQPTKGMLPNFDVAIDLLETAHAAGQNVDDATAYVAIAYIDAVGPGSLRGFKRKSSVKTNVAAEVKSILLRLAASGVKIPDLVFNRAAFHMLKSHHMRGAVALAMSAANSPAGGGRPGYNIWNYCVLIEAHSRTGDEAGIRDATKGAAASGCLGETKGYAVLKQARRRLRTHLDYENTVQELGSNGAKSTDDQKTVAAARKERLPRLEAALQAVEDALEQARAARQKLKADRNEFKSAVLRIMEQSAYGAANKPVSVNVDIDTIPQLQSMAA